MPSEVQLFGALPGLSTVFDTEPHDSESAAERLVALARRPRLSTPWVEYPALAGETRRAERPLAFVHVPKTAGTSLMKIMRKALRSPRKVQGLDPVLLGGLSDQGALQHSGVAQFFADGEALPPAADVVMGHFALSTLRQRYAQAQCVTFLREPAVRLLSHWAQWRAFGDEQLAGWGGWGRRVEAARGHLKDFLRDPAIACQTDNVALRMLLWPHAALPDGDFIAAADDDQLLRQALARLDGFAFIDVLENPSHLKAFGFWLGVGLPSRRLRPGDAPPAELRCHLEDELDDETLDLLHERCRLDLQLWRAVVRHRLPAADPQRLRLETLDRGIARYAEILAP